MVVGYGGSNNKSNLGRENGVLMNNGDGTYKQLQLDGGRHQTISIVLGDMNGDGHLDIVVGNYLGPNQVLLQNPDDNSFELVSLTSENMYPGTGTTYTKTNAVVVDDMNNDGKLDIVVGNKTPDNIAIYLNSGDGKLYERIEFTKEKVTSIAVGDLNNDDLIDIVVGNNGSVDQIMMNKGNNTYEYVELGEKNIETQAIQLGDMDGDGLVDIVVGAFGGRNYLYQNNGTSAYRRFKLPGGDTQTIKLELGDLNGDGQVDIVLLNEGADNEILLNRGGGEFVQLFLPFLKNGTFYDSQKDSTNVKDGATCATYVALGDLNNDKFVDVVLGIDPTVSSIKRVSAIQIEALMNGGGKGRYETKTLPNEKYYASSAVILEDLNGDGILDMVIGNYVGSNEVFMSNNKGTYDVTDLLDSTHYTTSLAVGDFNNDGRFDLVVGNYNNIQLYTDNGNNNYVPKAISVFDEGARGTDISSIAIGHLDGD